MADVPGGQIDAAPAQAALRWVGETPRKMTAAALEARLVRRFHCPRRDARRVIRSLVDRGRLAYVYLFGQSYIDLGLRCATPITNRFTLYPAGCQVPPAADHAAIVIAPGAAFGDGRHPTTRLALEGLEEIDQVLAWRGRSLRQGIDIGTGSGILAIAAARLGVARLDALDIDPCALNEARHNIALNHLRHRITLCRGPIERLEADYDLILANLRLPTLSKLADWVRHRTCPSGYLVFSGFREDEQDALLAAYPQAAFHRIWSRSLAGWRGIVLQAV